jgi:prepilin-type N-terminal cleavage/methylation domain-containing protein
MHAHSMKNRGYTLIELIVSVAIFSMIMLVVTTAYLALIAATRHARATSALMTNVDTAVDFMARTIRTGTSYSCNSAGDCPGGGTQFDFTDENNKHVTFLLLPSGAIGECINISCTSASASPLTDPAVTITSLTFYVRGTLPYSGGDHTQPNVVMSVKGKANVAGRAPVTFSIQTSATSRVVDIGT